MWKLGNIFLYQEQRGWTKQSYKDMWLSLGGTHSSCIKKMKGKVKEPGAYCMWLSMKAGVKPHGRAPKKGIEYPESFIEQGMLPFNLTQDEIDVLDDIGVSTEMLSKLQSKLNTTLSVETVNRLIQNEVVRDIIVDLYQRGYRGNEFIRELEKRLVDVS